MVKKIFQILPGDTEYLGVLIKSSKSLNYLNGHKGSIFTPMYYEIPICVYQE